MSTATDENNTPAPADETKDAPVEDANPNDLETELDDAQLQALVNEELGISVNANPMDTPAPETKPEGGKEDVKDDSNKPKNKENPDGDKGAPADKKDDPAVTESKVTEKTPEVPKTDEEEEPPRVEIPELKTDDLWLEVEKVTYDDEGNGKSETIKLVYDPENPGAFIPDDFKFKNDKQLADILEAKQEMANLYKERKAEIDARREEISSKEAEQTTQKEQIEGWDAEIEELIADGLLESPKAKVGDKDFLKDPSVAKIDATFKRMKSINEDREKEGKPPIRSFTAVYNKIQKEEADEAAKEAQKQENDEAKQKGALVGGGSAPKAGESRGYVAGSYGSIYDVPVDE